jgi:hypothetical protein
VRGGRLLRLLAGAALTGAPVLAACSGGIDVPLAATTSTTPDTAPTTTEALDVGQPLVVAEQGLISFPDPYDRGQSLGGYGVVLENPNPGLLAASVHITTRILNAAGAELLVDNALLNGIMPGTRMAVGRTLVEPIAGPTQLDIKVDVGGWIPPAVGTGDLKATEAVTEPEPNGGAVTRFAVQSSAASEEDGVDVAALYRAADGHLLAVETTAIDQLPPGQVVVGQIRLLAPIPGLASTEVLVGRGFSAQTTG